MKSILSAIVPLICLAACAGRSPVSEGNSFDSLYLLAENQWVQHHESDEFVRFQAQWLEFNNANHIDEQGNCYALARGPQDLILTQNAAGVIEQVTPRTSNRATDCFAEAFLGKEYPAPPFAPFYHFMRMQR